MFRIMAAMLVAAIAPVAMSTTAWAQAPGVAKAGSPLTVDSTIGELLDNPAARGVLQRHVPVIVASPQISQARGMSLRSIAHYIPALLTEERMAEINADLARTPGAIASGAAPRALTPLPADPSAAFRLQTIRLWEGRAPGAASDRPADIPTLTMVGTDGAAAWGTAVIIAPGGGYQALATGHEGRQVADWFAAHGITAFVLTYRLTPHGYRHPAQLLDAQRAIRWVRAHAADYGIDPNRIGMIGFSAGGHLTAMASTSFDPGNPAASDPIERVSSRPDFAVLGYPAIDIGARGWNALGLAGANPTEATKRALSPALNVTARTPPTFIFHTTTDELVSPRNATLYYDALRAANVPAELHIFGEGRHGLGLAMTDPALSVWPSLLRAWLQGRGFIGEKLVTGAK